MCMYVYIFVYPRDKFQTNNYFTKLCQSDLTPPPHHHHPSQTIKSFNSFDLSRRHHQGNHDINKRFRRSSTAGTVEHNQVKCI